MTAFDLKHYSFVFGIICFAAVILSLTLGVPYVYTAIGFATWAFVGHFITIDDDLPGGWGNLEGSSPFPWLELVAKAGLVFCLIGLILLYPAILRFGT